MRRLLVAGVVMAGLVGCREQPQITRRTIPKQESIQLDVAASTGSPAADAVPEWELPPGWRREPSTSSMRFATLRAGDVEFSVIPLPFPDGEEQQYLLSNINRWRGQLQMPVLDQLAGETEAIDLPDGSTATLVDLEGWQGSEATGDPTHRMLAAIIRHGDKAWFFKGTGSIDQFQGGLAEEFSGLIRSIKFSGQPMPAVAGRMPPDHPPLDSGSGTAGKPVLTYDVPAGWEAGERGSMRRAAFVAADGDQKAEITVIDLPSTGGNLLDNVNRWRGQIGLDPLASADKIERTDIEIDGKPATYLRIDGKDDTILAAVAPDVNRVWFFKLSGKRALADRETANFRSFVRSVKFPKTGS